jgi:hypothetical protein
MFAFLLAIALPLPGAAGGDSGLSLLPENLSGKWWRADSPSESWNRNNQSDAWKLTSVRIENGLVVSGTLKFFCQRGTTERHVRGKIEREGSFHKGLVWNLRVTEDGWWNQCGVNKVEFWQEGGRWLGRGDAKPFYPYLEEAR